MPDTLPRVYYQYSAKIRCYPASHNVMTVAGNDLKNKNEHRHAKADWYEKETSIGVREIVSAGLQAVDVTTGPEPCVPLPSKPNKRQTLSTYSALVSWVVTRAPQRI